MSVEHCHVTLSGASVASWQMLLDMNPISDLMLGWVLMVIAMMLPKLNSPIQHVCERSLKRMRFSSSLIFILGYVLVWTLVGFVMNLVILGFNLWMPMSYIPAIAVAIIAVVWQFSPVKQQFLNRSHNHWSIAAFGWKARKDVFYFGCMHGVWCVGAGWALMLFPMLLPAGHNLAMLIVAFVMISEHMEHPRVPAWRWSFRLKLFRLIIAQTKMRLVRVS